MWQTVIMMVKIDILFLMMKYIFVDYPDSQYRVVASSQFSLQNNNFAQFDVKMLHFPGGHDKKTIFNKNKDFLQVLAKFLLAA